MNAVVAYPDPNYIGPAEQRRREQRARAFAKRFGYYDADSLPPDWREVIRDHVERDGNALGDIFEGPYSANDPRVGQALVLLIERDDIAACDLLRDLLRPGIEARVEKLAKEEGLE